MSVVVTVTQLAPAALRMQGSIDPEREPAFRHSGASAGHLFGMPEPVNRRSRVKMPFARRRGEEVGVGVKKTVSRNCNRRGGAEHWWSATLPYCYLHRSGRTVPGTYETTLIRLGKNNPAYEHCVTGDHSHGKQKSTGPSEGMAPLSPPINYCHPLFSLHSQLLLSNSDLGSGTTGGGPRHPGIRVL